MYSKGTRRWKLSTRILVIQIGVLVLTLSVGFGLWLRAVRNDINAQYEQRALTVARVAANDRAIQSAMAAGDPGGTVAVTAERLRRVVDASYIVVIDLSRTRHSHPDPALIGQKVSERLIALDGHYHLGINPGNLGVSANAKVPLYSPGGRLIGEVSAGILERRVSADLSSSLPTLILYSVVALLVGAAASLFLARRLKQQTFGLELDELTSLLQEREAMLYGIREAVVILDPEGRVSLINEEARRLFHIGGDVLRRPLRDVLPEGKVRDLLAEGPAEVTDETLLTEQFALVVSRMPVSLGERYLGTVITARDRTETIGLLRELDSVKGLTDALRAQQHEHANRMHVVAGLLDLGRYDDAASYLREISVEAADISETLRETVGDPAVVALLLAKTTIAAEHGVVLRIRPAADEGRTGPVLGDDAAVDTRTVITVLGNLIDNAIEAVAGSAQAPHVDVRLERPAGSRELVIEVRDNGPGVADLTAVFQDGYTTKRSGEARGLGLALVQRLVTRSGGSVTVANDGGAVFRVVLPARSVVPVPEPNP